MRGRADRLIFPAAYKGVRLCYGVEDAMPLADDLAELAGGIPENSIGEWRLAPAGNEPAKPVLPEWWLWVGIALAAAVLIVTGIVVLRRIEPGE
jgi:hypothetical protein